MRVPPKAVCNRTSPGWSPVTWPMTADSAPSGWARSAATAKVGKLRGHDGDQAALAGYEGSGRQNSLPDGHICLSPATRSLRNRHVPS